MKPILIALLFLSACTHLQDGCDVTDPAWARDLGCYDQTGER